MSWKRLDMVVAERWDRDVVEWVYECCGMVGYGCCRMVGFGSYGMVG